VGIGSRGGKPEWKPKIVEGDGHIDCLDYLQSIVSDPSKSDRDRTAAALGLAPWQYVKPTGTKLATVVDLPPPQTIDEAIEQRGQIMGLERLRLLTKEDAAQLITELDGWVLLKRGPDHEQRLRALEAERRAAQDVPAIVVVEAATGILPGCEDIVRPEHVRIEAPKEEADDDKSGGTCSEDSGLGGSASSQGDQDSSDGNDDRG
jgi:hypothetical protein